MAPDVVVGNEGSHHRSSNTGGQVHQQQSETCVRKIQHFPKHDIVKLGEKNFLLWKHQALLILEGYDLRGYVLGTVNTPS